MTNITAGMVKDLRDKTGAGMMDCKAALAETGGDVETAVDWLRKKGLAKAAKKAGRIAADGLIGIATQGGRGAVVEVNSGIAGLVCALGSGRIKTFSGRSLREWQALVKTEGVYFAAMDRHAAGVPFDWAALAQDEGFADQAHFSRTAKRITGFSPSEFVERFVEDEAFWAYRLWV